MKELYDADDDQIVEGEPVRYYDFEFEQYTINKGILQELLLDEIILSNNQDARALNKELKTRFPAGVLEMIYERQEQDLQELATIEDKPKQNKETGKTYQSSS